MSVLCKMASFNFAPYGTNPDHIESSVNVKCMSFGTKMQHWPKFPISCPCTDKGGGSDITCALNTNWIHHPEHHIISPYRQL